MSATTASVERYATGWRGVPERGKTAVNTAPAILVSCGLAMIGRKQKSAKEAVWRARAKATKAAVKQTRALYEQAMAVRPRPGEPIGVIKKSQEAAKAAMEAAEQAEKDLKEEARRARIPPGWLR